MRKSSDLGMCKGIAHPEVGASCHGSVTLFAFAVSFAFFLCDDLVLPLTAVFVGFPAAAVVSAKFTEVNVTHIVGEDKQLSAGAELIVNQLVVITVLSGGIAQKSASFDDAI